MNSPANRRAFLRGLTIASATAATGAFSLPAPAAADMPHADAELLAIFAETERLEAEREAAREVARSASRAARREQSPIPDVLMLTEEENRIGRSWRRLGHLHFGPAFRWRDKPQTTTGLYFQPDPAWTGIALRRAIEGAVADLGPAGRTPHLLRRWRGLLPVADAYDRHVEEAYKRHRTGELHDAERRADKALEEARARLQSLPATTPEGLAAHVRMFDGFNRENIPKHVLPLLLSAAAVAGTAVKFYEPEGET